MGNSGSHYKNEEPWAKVEKAGTEDEPQLLSLSSTQPLANKCLLAIGRRTK